jgi:hypothetical protein
VVPDDEFCDPLSLDDPPGARTPPTPPVVPSPSPSPAPMRQRAMAHLRPVSIPDIVRTMAGKNPVHEMADFDRHYMRGGLPSPDASARGNAVIMQMITALNRSERQISERQMEFQEVSVRFLLTSHMRLHHWRRQRIC